MYAVCGMKGKKSAVGSFVCSGSGRPAVAGVNAKFNLKRLIESTCSVHELSERRQWEALESVI